MPMSIEETMKQAVSAHRAGQLAEAERSYRAVLQQDPAHPDAHHNLGVLAVSVQRADQALPHFRAAVSRNPRVVQYWLSLIDALLRTGLASEADQALAAARRHGVADSLLAPLSRRIASPDASSWLAQGNAHAVQGRLDAAIAAWTRALEIDARLVAAQANLGVALLQQGQPEAAVAHLQRAAAAAPQRADILANLGAALMELGRHADALACCDRALSVQPRLPMALANRALALRALGRPGEAEASYRTALASTPDDPGLLADLAATLLERGHPSKAAECCRRALAVAPGHANALQNLGAALIEQARFAEAVEVCRQALARSPDQAALHSNLLFALNYVDSVPAEAARDEACRWGDARRREVASPHRAWRCDPSAARLRVGFVSGDLREHPVGHFIEGLLRAIDRQRFELLAFPTARSDDPLARELQPLFDGWHPIDHLDDTAAARRIHESGVHVLVDLAGHTAHNRLPVFAHRPAPLQIAWLGYFATTGLAEIDWVLGDPQVTPPDEEHHFRERIWRLPETYLCFSPPRLDVPVGPLPALQSGRLTFGCFNNLSKLNDAVVALWTRVLQAVPDSRLLLKARQLSDPAVARATAERFARQGLASDRLQFEGPSPRAEYLRAYDRVDIALDPFPFPGGTTSVEGLWMGVPVLGRRGRRFIGHNGETILRNLGLDDWIAEDDDDYLARARRLAGDLDALSQLRAGLRGRLLRSPLVDAPRFARHFDEALQALWQARGWRG